VTPRKIRAKGEDRSPIESSPLKSRIRESSDIHRTVLAIAR
jgi:hypothetical protein